MGGLNIIHLLIILVILGSIAAIGWGIYRLIAAGVRKGTIDAATHQQPSASNPPAGWYPDTDGSADLQWWDGTAWTGHRKPADGAS